MYKRKVLVGLVYEIDVEDDEDIPDLAARTFVDDLGLHDKVEPEEIYIGVMDDGHDSNVLRYISE